MGAQALTPIGRPSSPCQYLVAGKWSENEETLDNVIARPRTAVAGRSRSLLMPVGALLGLAHAAGSERSSKIPAQLVWR